MRLVCLKVEIEQFKQIVHLKMYIIANTRILRFAFFVKRENPISVLIH